MVSGFLAVQTLLVVQRQGWFADWLSTLDTARVWLANGREGAGLARAVRLVWEEEQEEIARISRELRYLDAGFDDRGLPLPRGYREDDPRGYREDDDGHFDFEDDDGHFVFDSDWLLRQFSG